MNLDKPIIGGGATEPKPPPTRRRRVHPVPGLSTVKAAKAWLRRLARQPVYRSRPANEYILKLARLELADALDEARRMGGGQ